LTIVATLALTLGIGLTTTMFSIVYSALMRGLPSPDGDHIMAIGRSNPAKDIRNQSLPFEDFVDYRKQQQTFTGLAGSTSGTIYVSGDEKAERFTGACLSAHICAM